MGMIDKFEGIMEGAVEKQFALFKKGVDAAEVAKRLERVMEEQRKLSVGKTYVPNRYEVYLHPEDYNNLAPYKTQFERDWSFHITGYAAKRGFDFSSHPPHVWLNSSDQLRKRQISIKAYTLDPNQAVPVTSPNPADLTKPEDQSAPVEKTTVLNVGSLALTGERPAAGVTRPEATLVVVNSKTPSSKHYRFNQDVTIGRNLDNNIVFPDDQRVSGHHARIVFKFGQFLLYDLNSTNGTTVNQQPVTQIVLTPGDHISLGGLELILQVDS